MHGLAIRKPQSCPSWTFSLQAQLGHQETPKLSSCTFSLQAQPGHQEAPKLSFLDLQLAGAAWPAANTALMPLPPSHSWPRLEAFPAASAETSKNCSRSQSKGGVPSPCSLLLLLLLLLLVQPGMGSTCAMRKGLPKGWHLWGRHLWGRMTLIGKDDTYGEGWHLWGRMTLIRMTLMGKGWHL